MGGFQARIGKEGQADDIIGQYGGYDKKTSGIEMLKFMERNEMKTLKDTAQKTKVKWTWSRKCKGGGNAPFLIRQS